MTKHMCALLVAACVVATSRPALAVDLKERLKTAILASELTPSERVQHFLSRIACGGNPSNVTYERFAIPAASGNGIDAAASAEAIAEEIVATLDSLGLPNPSVEARVRALYPLNALSPLEVVRAFKTAKDLSDADGSRFRAELRRDLAVGHVVRHALEERGLRNTLFDFWFDHFNVDSRKASLDVSGYLDTIRAGIGGTFLELLVSVAKHPAMLIYLDNTRSVRQRGEKGPNENYARELLELHTLGVGPTSGVYNQADVQQVALILTGWNVTSTDGYTAPREFVFRPFLHDESTKRVMGVTYPPGGIEQGERLLAFLAAHPRTARNIANKLVRKLVTESSAVSADLRARVALRFLSTGGNLKAVYAEILASPLFWSRSAFHQKAKRPIEFVGSALKLTGAHPGSLSRELVDRAYNSVRRMGQAPFMYGPPTGPPDLSADWVNATTVIESVRFGVAVADYRGNSASNRVLYLAWQEWVRNLPADMRSPFTLQAMRAFHDLNNVVHRFNLSLLVFIAGAASLLPLAAQYPDRVNGHDAPIRFSLGAFIGSKDFLKK